MCGVTSKIHSLKGVLLLAAILAAPTVRAAEFCYAPLDPTWEAAPIGVNAQSLGQKLKEVYTSRHPKGVTEEDIDRLISAEIDTSARTYCYRNQKTCLAGNGKCLNVKSCEIGYSPRASVLESRMAGLNQALENDNFQGVAANLDLSGYIPRVKSICCTDEPVEKYQCLNTIDQKFLMPGKPKRVQSNVDTVKPSNDGFEKAIQLWNQFLNSKASLDQQVHNDCTSPMSKIPLTVIHPKAKQGGNMFSKALQLTKRDMIHESSYEQATQNAAFQMVNSNSHVNSQVNSASSAAGNILNALSGIPYYTGRFLKYLTIFSGGDSEAYFRKNFGVSLDEADPDLELMLAEIKAEYEKEKGNLKPQQNRFVVDLLKSIDEQMRLIKLNKANGLIALGDRNALARSLADPKKIVLRKSDLRGVEGGPQLDHNLQKFLNVVQLFGVQTHEKNAGNADECNELITAHPEFKEFLMQKAAKIAEKAREPRKSMAQAESIFAFSEPGTLKTSSIIQMAACAKVPICVINEESLTRDEYEKKRVPFAERLKKEISRCHKTDLVVGENGQCNYHSVLLVDDIDRILNNHLNSDKYKKVATMGMGDEGGDDGNSTPHDNFNRAPDEDETQTDKAQSVQNWDVSRDHKAAEVAKERSAFLGVLKNISDASQLFEDSETGFPIDLSGETLWVTSNSIPDAFLDKGKADEKPVGSRFTMYSIPYPKAEFRKEIVEKKWADLNERYKPKGKTLDENCKTALDEILKYDVNAFENRKKKMGVRALFQFLDAFSAYVAQQATRGDQLDCRGFNVAERAVEFRNEYTNKPNDTLLSYDYTNEMLREVPDIQSEIKIDGVSQGINNWINNLRLKALDVSQPYNHRQKYFEYFKHAMDYYRIVGKREKSQDLSPYTKEELVSRFNNHLKLLMEGEELKRWQLAAKDIFRKIESKISGTNHVIVLDPEPGAETGFVEQLAEVFAAPFYRVDAKDAFLKASIPWSKYRWVPKAGEEPPEAKMGKVAGGHEETAIQYDLERRVFYAQSPDGRVAIFSREQFEQDDFKVPKMEVSPEIFYVPSMVTHKWFDNAVRRWANEKQKNQGIGFVVIESDDVADTVKVLNDLFKDTGTQILGSIRQEAPKEVNKINVFVLPKSQKALSQDQKIRMKGKNELVLKLPGLKSTGELATWAIRRLDYLLKGFEARQMPLQVTDQDRDSFKKFIENLLVLHRKKKAESSLQDDVELVELAIRSFVNELEKRNGDIFSSDKLESIPIGQLIHEIESTW